MRRALLLGLLLALVGCRESPVGRHPLYPLRAGQWWSYRVEGVPGGERRRVSSIVEVDDLRVARVETEAAYQVSACWVVDAPDGIRLLPDFGRRPDARLLREAPLLLPARLSTGSNWSYQGAVPFALGGDDGSAGAVPQVRSRLTVGPREAVEAGGRKYDALRIDAETVYDLVPPMRAEEHYWYASGVGLVRYESAVAERGRVAWELVDHGGEVR